jgi:hypothetical protein
MDLEAIYRAPRAVFRELLDQTAAELENATYVEEWLGAKQRLPVFDVQVLRDFLGVPAHRDRLAALLASYVHVQSGSVWERSAGRWRRRRYSELNPVDLAELGAFARLGDLALFLSGVFPEHVSSHPLEPRIVARLATLLERNPGEIARAKEPFWMMEWLGKSAYARAGEPPLAESFRTARRLLNVLTGRHLFPVRDRWFGGPGGTL